MPGYYLFVVLRVRATTCSVGAVHVQLMSTLQCSQCKKPFQRLAAILQTCNLTNAHHGTCMLSQFIMAGASLKLSWGAQVDQLMMPSIDQYEQESYVAMSNDQANVGQRIESLFFS